MGHQCYAHKLLTGRRDRFGTIRQYGGLSGFPNRAESPHDVVGTGHASTSISYGLGLVEAAAHRPGERRQRRLRARRRRPHGRRRLRGAQPGRPPAHAARGGPQRQRDVHPRQRRRPAALPQPHPPRPDAHAPARGPRARRRQDPGHRPPGVPAGQGRQGVDEGACSCPACSSRSSGFAYIGVVDGHDMHALRESIRQAIDTRRPVVVHVKTVKGKGYEPAEARPDAFHGTGPFHIGNGAQQGGGGRDDVHRGVRPGAGAPRRARRARRGHHRRHDAGHRPRGVRAPVPRPLLRRRHRRGARRRVRRRPRHRRHAAGGRALLDVPAARLRHAGAGHRPAAPAGDVRRRPGRPGRRRRPDAPRRLRPLVPARDPRHDGHGAVQPGGAAAHAGARRSHSTARRRCATRAASPRRSAPLDRARAAARWGAAEVLQEGADVALVGVGTGVGIALEAAALLAARGRQRRRWSTRASSSRSTPSCCSGSPPRTGASSPSRRTRSPAGSAAPSSRLSAAPCEVVRFGLPDAFVPHGDRGARARRHRAHAAGRRARGARRTVRR